MFQNLPSNPTGVISLKYSHPPAHPPPGPPTRPRANGSEHPLQARNTPLSYSHSLSAPPFIGWFCRKLSRDARGIHTPSPNPVSFPAPRTTSSPLPVAALPIRLARPPRGKNTHSDLVNRARCPRKLRGMRIRRTLGWGGRGS